MYIGSSLQLFGEKSETKHNLRILIFAALNACLFVEISKFEQPLEYQSYREAVNWFVLADELP
jgi:hypothetical protein